MSWAHHAIRVLRTEAAHLLDAQQRRAAIANSSAVCISRRQGSSQEARVAVLQLRLTAVSGSLCATIWRLFHVVTIAAALDRTIVV
jgi:hypothetical protein